MSDRLADRARLVSDLADASEEGRRAALASLADVIAHEFNNLRSVIDGTLGLLAADPRALTAGNRLARLQKASAKAGALAGGWANLARLRRGGGPLDLGAWILAARPWLAERVGGAAALTLALPPEPLRALAHPNDVRIVVRALVDNAAAALTEGGHVSIALATDDARRMLSLSVTDDGVGMSPEVAARAREAFFTTRPPAAGLGLIVVELFAKEHGGALELSSAPGRGTTASLSLPIADPARGPAPA